MERSAIIDETGQYRYQLVREWEPADPRVLWIMLNPSTADGTEDDPTIRRCVGFAKAWGFGSIEVVNLFAFRATEPDDLMALLRYGGDAIGPENDDHILEAAEACGIIIGAWGAHKSAGAWDLADGRAASVCRLLSRRDINCLRITASGHPSHPLYLPGNLTPIPLNPHARMAANISA